MTEGAAAIARATDMVFRAEMSAMARLTAEETRLREAAATLEAQARRTVAEAAEVEGMAGTGADLLWRSWLQSRRRDVMIELAAVMARTADARTRLARAGGRAQVAAGLAEQVREDARRQRAKRAHTEFEAQMILAAAAARRDA